MRAQSKGGVQRHPRKATRQCKIALWSIFAGCGMHPPSALRLQLCTPPLHCALNFAPPLSFAPPTLYPPLALHPLFARLALHPRNLNSSSSRSHFCVHSYPRRATPAKLPPQSYPRKATSAKLPTQSYSAATATLVHPQRHLRKFTLPKLPPQSYLRKVTPA